MLPLPLQIGMLRRGALGLGHARMSNRLAIVLIILIAMVSLSATLLLDDPHILVGKKLIDLVDLLAFWR